MLRSMFQRLGLPLLGASAAALILVTTTALAGSGVGAVFNLGQVNTVNAQSTLSGNPGGSPLLQVTGTGTAASIKANAGSGIAVNGVSTSGTGQAGQSTSGYGLSGLHTGSTGANSGVYGQTSSTDPGSAGVTGRNLGGGPGLQSIVTSNSVAPLKVNSTAKVVNLNADLLDGLDSTGLPYWKLGGNAGTTPGPNFLGTTDNKPLELRVNGSRVLRLEPDATSPNLIGGYSGNSATAGAYGVTIAGGGASGGSNSVLDNFGTIGGGSNNSAGLVLNGLTDYATVAGGYINTASGQSSAVAGGVGNTASGQSSAVAGGFGNVASGFYSTVAGGFSNTASGPYSFAAGRRAQATQQGSFVWGDSTDADVTSPAADSFTVRASGGTFIKGKANVSNALSTGVVAFANGDTTPSVSGGNVFETNNTGATLITNFTGGAAGQTITIVFHDANTQVENNGAAIFLKAGGMNFASTANDTLTLVCTNGTKWYEVSRSVND
jgi:hypothetical protein